MQRHSSIESSFSDHRFVEHGSLPQCVLPQGEAKGPDDRISTRSRPQVIHKLLEGHPKIPMSILRIRREGKGGSCFNLHGQIYFRKLVCF